MSYYVSVYKQTQDCWYPSYEYDFGMLVRVSMFQMDDGCWRVHCSGMDDFTVMKELKPNEENQARCLFLDLIGREEVNLDDVLEMGFKGDC